MNASRPLMGGLLVARDAIYNQFHASSAGPAHFFLDSNAEDYAAYYTAMYLIQDTAEAIYTHAEKGFATSSMAAYIEFWGVMQATQIQQVSMAETKCARWRVKSVPVWLIEKGCESPGLFSSIACIKARGA